MIEFNPDGSIRLPEKILNQRREHRQKMQKQRAILVHKDIVSDRPPKRCILHISLSEAIDDNRFMETIYRYFQNESEVPSKFSKINEKEFEIEIGTCLRRCTDCSSLMQKYKEFLSGNVIVEKGNCTFGDSRANFSYEDYFD